jgi:hypothetical protein
MLSNVEITENVNVQKGGFKIQYDVRKYFQGINYNLS